MRRRRFLAVAGAAGGAGLAGCAELVETRQIRSAPGVLADRPAAVYFPTHVEGMLMAGTAAAGDYRFALMYSYPHRFWNVNGTSVSMTDTTRADEVHLMATVWDGDSGQVLPDTGLTVEIERGGELVGQEVIYPMLSQPMGFHYGANFALDGDGEYDVTLSVGGMSTRRTGGFRGRFDEPERVTVPFEYARAERDGIDFQNTADRAGERAAREPMAMGGGMDGSDGMDMDTRVPLSVLPPAAELPGTLHGVAETGDARLAVVSSEPPAGIDGDRYLAISARTPYNRMVLPAMALEGTLVRNDESVYDGRLTATLDPELGYHYGAAVPSVETGDRLELRVTVPPQVARHEGYETAFLEMEPTEVTL
jgi:hypothetical protein